MSASYTYPKYDVRAYFEQYTQFQGKNVLDFGCNRASFVSFKPHGNYTGIDVKENIINKNKFHYPQYKFEYYNGYNYMYNPKGNEELVLKNHYDVCVAFSVFTHHTFEETKSLIDTLKEHCDNIYLTYFSNKDRYAYEKVCWWRELEPNMWPQIESHDVFYLKTDKWLWTFYDDDWLADKLNGQWYNTKFPKDEIRGMQRCLVI
jgi:2-polyprenyl-3-methyl-5-hydroxy-6-metoxy-1,4-benzoquinol methylase